MNKQKIQPHIVAVVLEKSSQFFISRRIGPGKFKNFWQNPGGKVEPGETPKTAIVRETFEETGLLIEPKRFKRIGSLQLYRRREPYTITTYRLKLRHEEEPRRTEKKHGPWRAFSKDSILKRHNVAPALQKVLQAA
jgi:8-oxo-dGTP diphosphatase